MKDNPSERIMSTFGEHYEKMNKIIMREALRGSTKTLVPSGFDAWPTEINWAVSEAVFVFIETGQYGNEWIYRIFSVPYDGTFEFDEEYILSPDSSDKDFIYGFVENIHTGEKKLEKDTYREWFDKRLPTPDKFLKA